MRRIALALLLALALPTVLAHVERPWPIIQSSQPFRDVQVDLIGTKARLVMTLPADPARHGIVLEIDPSSVWRAEYRVDPPDPGSAFGASWNWSRLLEYKDLNADGRYDPRSDTVVRGWRFDALRWNATPVTTATIDRLEVQTVTWTATAPNGPSFRLQLAVAGRDFIDEGARARPQDAMLYLDVLNLPARGTGNLHAFEGTMLFPRESNWGIFRTEGYDSAFVVELPRRQAHFVWGGSAVIDGAEQAVRGALDEHVETDGRWASAWRLDMPIAERTMRFVFTFGLEYVPEDRRAPAPAGLVLVALGLAGLLWQGRRR